MNIVPMATADLLAAYASRISEVERLLIAHSPVAVMPGTVAESAYLPPELQMKRYYAHLVLPRLSGLLRKGLDLDVNPEGFRAGGAGGGGGTASPNGGGLAGPRVADAQDAG